jgi:hypothetical protein
VRDVNEAAITVVAVESILFQQPTAPGTQGNVQVGPSVPVEVSPACPVLVAPGLDTRLPTDILKAPVAKVPVQRGAGPMVAEVNIDEIVRVEIGKCRIIRGHRSPETGRCRYVRKRGLRALAAPRCGNGR